MLTTCCLRSSVCSGHQKEVANAKWHKKLLKRWLEGDIPGLWAESKAKMNHRRNKTPKQDIQKRKKERDPIATSARPYNVFNHWE